MKKSRLLCQATTLILMFAMILLSNCKEDDPGKSRVLKITSFSPSQSRVGEIITITGENFSSTASENIVSFNNTTNTQAASSTETALSVMVPVGATSGKLKVTVKSKSAVSDNDFVVLVPSITSFSPLSGPRRSSVTITGSNFSSTPANNIVKFNGIQATVTSVTQTQIVATVPDGATKGKITISIAGNTFTSTDDFVVLGLNSWLTDAADFAGTARIGGFALVINGKAYIGIGLSQSVTLLKDFWEYTPETNSWTQKADFAGMARSYATGFVIGLKGYVGTGFNGGLFKDFWEYNPAINGWTKKADFHDVRSSATGFAVGNKGYIGLGVGGPSEHEYFNDLWEYDPATDQWVSKQNFAGLARENAVSFVMGTKAYVGDGDGATGGLFDFWEYDPSVDHWIKKADIPYDITNMVNFTIGNRGYVGSFLLELWMYKQDTDEWIRKADLPERFYLGVGFAIGNSGYMGLGQNSMNVLTNKIYRYVPD